jgi:hypothetical protein
MFCAIVPRNVLEGLSEADRTRALDNFRASGARWLLASLSGNNPGKNAIQASLGSGPCITLPDGDNATLGVWQLPGE